MRATVSESVTAVPVTPRDGRPTRIRNELEKPTPASARILASILGRIVRIDGSGPAVDFPGNPARGPVAARTTVSLGPAAVDREVVLLFENGDPSRPIVMGLLQSVEQRAVAVADDVERLVLSASKEVVLKCGAASITLTQAGKVLIRGADVVSRSSGSNRIKGASVEIN